MLKKNKGFSWVEVVIIVAIVAIIVVILIVLLNPKKILSKSRDDRRNSDMSSIYTAVNLYLADNRDFSALKKDTIYDSTNGKTKNNGSGWIPLDFTKVTSGAPLTQIPQDPSNDKEKNLYYRFGANPQAKSFEIDCVFENAENLSKQTSDGGNNNSRYEIGTDLTILP